VLVDAIVGGYTASSMQTLFLHAEAVSWAVVDAPNKESTVQRLLKNLREDGGEAACRAAMELVRLVLAKGSGLELEGRCPSWFEPLLDSVAADGWEFDLTHETLVPTVPSAAVVEEVGWIERELARRGWSTAAGHYRQAIDALADGNWAAANGQLRTFFEALMVAAGGSTGGGHSGQVQAAADALHAMGRLMPNEAEFVKALWKLLHPAGSHPGLSGEDESRFRLLSLTGYVRFLLIRLP
jgi:hypothetical protein